ncbi:tail fiber domain-containing protein [Mycobacterium sp. EPa45]|uniref:tail fiber domain-containing protein n=1 Tax=Mycobacterium sp. EPa45 TaxID=1545728 RepID=UPI001F28379E|nr:tail fiber domain-containing protein [Mycobacterium sp. EPa45]
MTESPQAPTNWADSPTRRRAKAQALIRHPQAWAARVIRRQRGVAAGVEVPVSAQEILDRLTQLPISVWTYGYDHDSVRHLGPMAQDFAAAFGLGDNDRRINLVDANGVVMAALQALTRRVSELEDQLGRIVGAEPIRAAVTSESPSPAAVRQH